MGYKIRRSTARELLKASGYDLADQYTDKVLVRKLGYLNDISDEDAAIKFTGPLKRVFSTLRLALREGQEPEIVPEPETPKPLGRPKSEESVGSLIVAMLKKVTEVDPITKLEVCEKLFAKFPERSRDGIRMEVDKWIMSYCRRDGHDIKKSTKGFWIEPTAE